MTRMSDSSCDARDSLRYFVFRCSLPQEAAKMSLFLFVLTAILLYLRWPEILPPWLLPTHNESLHPKTHSDTDQE
jgi:hypothetical protein